MDISDNSYDSMEPTLFFVLDELTQGFSNFFKYLSELGAIVVNINGCLRAQL